MQQKAIRPTLAALILSLAFALGPATPAAARGIGYHEAKAPTTDVVRIPSFGGFVAQVLNLLSSLWGGVGAQIDPNG